VVPTGLHQRAKSIGIMLLLPVTSSKRKKNGGSHTQKKHTQTILVINFRIKLKFAGTTQGEREDVVNGDK